MIEYKHLYCNYLIKDKLVIQYEFQRDAVEEIKHTSDMIEYKRLRHVKILGWLDKQKNSHKQRTSPEYKSNTPTQANQDCKMQGLPLDQDTKPSFPMK